MSVHPCERIHVDGKPLGRFIVHDERSRAYPARRLSAISTIIHPRRVPIFNQKQLGSCTGNAEAGCLSTAPFTQEFNEVDAIGIYSAATEIDSIRGTYPPTDTGSSGLAVSKVAKDKGWISGYGHAFDVEAAFGALQLGPGIFGLDWYQGFDTPNAAGEVESLGLVRGGHEVEIVGVDVLNDLVWFVNSWGEEWGVDLPGLGQKGGAFCMSTYTFRMAMRAGGDVIFPEVP